MSEEYFFDMLGGELPPKRLEMGEMYRTELSGHDITCKLCWARVAPADRARHHTWHYEEEQRIATMAIEIVKMLSEIPDLGGSQ